MADRDAVVVGDGDAELARGAAGGDRRQVAAQGRVEWAELVALAGPAPPAEQRDERDGQVRPWLSGGAWARAGGLAVGSASAARTAVVIRAGACGLAVIRPSAARTAVVVRADPVPLAVFAVVACDFFTDPLPSGAGGYLLAHVIHNWNDEQALAILRAVRVAIPDDGQLLLVEAVIPDDDSPHLAKDLDVRLITILPGGGRTESEYARLLTEAGFRPGPAAGLARIESVIVAIPSV